MSVAGSHQLVHAIRMTLDADPEEVCVRIDFHNADTSVYWRTVGDSLLTAPTLRPGPLSACWSRPRPWRLMASCGAHREQPKGGCRGTPRQVSTSMWASRRTWKVLDDRLAAHGGLSRFGHDDGYAVGRPEYVFPVITAFAAAVEAGPQQGWSPARLVHSKAGPQQVRFVPPEWNPALQFPACQAVPGSNLAKVADQWENGFLCSNSFVKVKMIERWRRWPTGPQHYQADRGQPQVLLASPESVFFFSLPNPVPRALYPCLQASLLAWLPVPLDI